MDYTKTTLKEELVIKRIVTVHYFEYASDYVFEGEKHDFWEFLYVDKGEVEVMADTLGYQLKQGEIIFHKPNEFHSVWANGKVAPNLIVVSFECRSPSVRYFENKILEISNNEKNLLAQIIREARAAFASPLDNPSLKSLEKRVDPLFASEQLIRIHLEQLLISLIRKGKSLNTDAKLSSVVKERLHEDLTNKIITFLEDHLTSNISFGDVCSFSCLSRTNLKVLFKENTNMGVMEYYKNLKIEQAKKLIREGAHNFTQIAEMVGYTSIFHFSKQFKKVTGMTPSQYACSVKVKI